MDLAHCRFIVLRFPVHFTNIVFDDNSVLPEESWRYYHAGATANPDISNSVFNKVIAKGHKGMP